MRTFVGLSLLLVVMAGCSGSEGVAYRVPYTRPSGVPGVPLTGTAHDDLWSVSSDGKDAQDDPFDLHVEYWDGKKVTAVPISFDVFHEGACGLPSTGVAVSRGEIWLASFRVPNCGFPTDSSYDKFIFGKLKSDGTWEDHSADFPVGTSGTYKRINLQGRDGLLFVGVEYGLPNTSYKLFRYAQDGTHTELPLPSGFTGSVDVIGADELLLGNELYRNGAWSTLDALPFNPGAHHINTGGERWSFGPQLDQSPTVDVLRYADGQFTTVTMRFPEGEAASNNFVPLNIVPRGGGKLLWLTVGIGVHLGGITIEARDFDGTTLSKMRTIQTQGPCNGASDDCLARAAGVTTLADGSAIVNNVPFTFAVPVTGL